VIEEKYRALSELALTSVPGIRRTGLRIVALRDRYARAVMPFEGNINHVGMMYAGSLFSLGEFAGGIIYLVSLNIHKYFPIVKQVTIRFRRPALTDVTMEVMMTGEEAVRIEAEAERDGKADFTLNLDLKDAHEVTVAEVEGIWQVRVITEEMRRDLDIP